MSKYIKREDAIAYAKHAYAKGLNVLEYLDEVPAADVVPVVRCKDCAEWQKGWEPRKANNGEHFCANVGLITAPEWYCADGNREGGWK